MSKGNKQAQNIRKYQIKVRKTKKTLEKEKTESKRSSKSG